MTAARSLTFASLAFASLGALGLVAACSSDDAPTDHQLAHETHLGQYATCGALEADLKNMVIREAWADIDQTDSWRGRGFPGADSAGASGGAGTNGGGRQEGVDYSGTNNQVHGVDEADGVKTDGYHVYAINGNRLHIFGVPQFGQLVPESVTKLEGHPREMLLDATSNRVVVFSMIPADQLPKGHPLRDVEGADDGYGGWWWRSRLITKITVVDITSRTAPALVNEVYFEGWYDTARKVDSSIRIAAYTDIQRPELWNWWKVYNEHGASDAKQWVVQQVDKLGLDDLIPMLYVRTPDGHFTSNSLSTASCQAFFRPSDSHARGFSTIISFDLLGQSVNWNAVHVVSNYPTFYESQNMIVLTEPAHAWWWYWWFSDDPDQLNVHAFDTTVPGQTTYLASGRVEGALWNQFAIDEHDGAIRLATTNFFWSRWWNESHRPTITNDVWVLQNDGRKLARVGHLDNITPGEQLTAVRFLGTKGYLSTFRYVDPLITVDLADPTNPRIAGELQVPGESSYLHPLGDHDLLSIGFQPGTQANGWQWKTMVSTFDVGDFAHPQLAASLPLSCDSGWSWSEALWNHKAFTYWEPKKLLAVPMSNWINSGGSYHYLSRLELLDVDPATGTIGHHGTIDHTPYYEADNRYWWSYVDIRRSIFMGDYVYAISDKAISVHRTADLAKVADALLPGYKDGDWWWWW